MNPLPNAFLRASILALGLAVAPLAMQTAVAQPVAPEIQPDDAQLQKFAKAATKVSVVADEYQAKLQSAPDAETREELIQEADEKMILIAKADGLSVDEYNGISVAVQRDPKLRQRVAELANKPGG